MQENGQCRNPMPPGRVVICFPWTSCVPRWISFSFLTPPSQKVCLFWGLENGPAFGSANTNPVRGSVKNTAPFLYVSLEKAMASWQWFRFLLAQVPPDRKPLILNLDETSIRFWYEPRLGLRARARDRVSGRASARQASRGLLRKAFTHIAVICDDPALQPLLPQVILVNERTCTIRTLQDWKPLPGCKAEVFRHKSAWINNAKFADVLRRIGQALKTHAPDRQAIMLMDAHISHFSQEALVEASAQGIWPCIIPASTTSILQPLDTHVFARFKFFCEPVCIRRC